MREKEMAASSLFITTWLMKNKTTAQKMNRLYAQYQWSKAKSFRKKIRILKNTILSIMMICPEIYSWTQECGKEAKIITEKPIALQAMEQAVLALSYSIRPSEYYWQELYLEDGKKRAPHYIKETILKNKSLYNVLKEKEKQEISKDIRCSFGNKKVFAETCLKHHIPVVPILMMVDMETKKTLPCQSIFCKPNVGKEGLGGEVWHWEKELFKNHLGQHKKNHELLDHLKQQSTKFNTPMIIQPLVRPHQQLSRFYVSAVPTIRMITVIDQEKRVYTELAMLRFNLNKNAIVDNASAGGMIAPINIQSGQLGKAASANPKNSLIRYSAVPGTSLLIEGVPIPYWQTIRTLVNKAHHQFSYRTIVGWDIAITDKGPLILEANRQPGITYIQRANKVALGQTKTGNILYQEINNYLNSEERRSLHGRNKA